MTRSSLSAQERAWRSRLTQLVSQEAFARGTLAWRDRVCGKPNCRCARGERHRSLYLIYREGSKTRQAYVPPAWHEQVEQWVARYQEVRELLGRLSESQYRRLRERKGSGC
jgi:hypothetical protein